MPEGFYVYEPVILPPAATTVVSDGMSGAERWKSLHDRIKAKERASNARPERYEEAGRGGSHILNPLTGPDMGGGVREYLFPSEIQHPSNVERPWNIATCTGKYRIRAKGAACHGSACCEGA